MTGSEGSPTRIMCRECGRDPINPSPAGWFAQSHGEGQPRTFVCTFCQTTWPTHGELTPLMLPGSPVSGAFKPCRTDKEIFEARTTYLHGDYWLDLERTFLEELDRFGKLILRFNVGSYYYKGMRITPVWEGDEIVAIEASGTNAKTKLQLDIYQTHRLRQLGYTSDNSKPETWRVDLTPQERGLINIARIISNTLEYGYMIQESRMHAIEPVLDIDIRDLKEGK